MKRIFQGVAGNNPSLNRFDLSYTNTLSMSFGYLYPVQVDEVYPGDVFKMSCYCHAELMPLVAPVMSDIQMFAHTFFVPYRLIYGVDNEDGKSIFEKFITGGQDGDYVTPLPSWSPNWSKVGFSSLKIWDYVGNPVAYDPLTSTWTPIVPGGLDVSIAPKYAYNFIYNNYYRDENLVKEVSFDNEDLLKAAFKKDYFTSALLQQQRGTAPALPVDVEMSFDPTGVYGKLASGEATIYGGNVPFKITGSNVPVYPGESYMETSGVPATSIPLWYNGSSGNVSASSDRYQVGLRTSDDEGGLRGTVNRNVNIDSSASSAWNSAIRATTFNVSDLRLAFAIQRMMELNERAGVRFTEWLSAHFNAHPTDARLDRPEYIGGALLNVSVSPLTQNSESATTPQGTKVGIGRVDSVQKLGNYRVLEHGLIMTLVSIRPKPIYKQGINRQWLRQVKEDYYIPELAYLSEQGIYNAELYVDGESGGTKDDDDGIFGYQARWNELRCKNNLVSGAVREQFDYWTLARDFASRPHLNQDFIEIDKGDFNHIFAVQDEDSFIVSWSNLIDAYRPIPAMGVPGLVDHVYGGSY